MPSNELKSLVKLYSTPLSRIELPPSSIELPPEVAVVNVTFERAFVCKVGVVDDEPEHFFTYKE